MLVITVCTLVSNLLSRVKGKALKSMYIVVMYSIQHYRCTTCIIDANHTMHIYLLQPQRYTYRVLQTIQMQIKLLCVWAEWAILGSVKTAFYYKRPLDFYDEPCEFLKPHVSQASEESFISRQAAKFHRASCKNRGCL